MNFNLTKRALGDAPVAPALPNVTRFLNDELRPFVRELRQRVNDALAGINSSLPLAEYAPGSEPVVDGNALILNAATRRPRFTSDSGATWTDL